MLECCFHPEVRLVSSLETSRRRTAVMFSAKCADENGSAMDGVMREEVKRRPREEIPGCLRTRIGRIGVGKVGTKIGSWIRLGP